MPTKKKNNLRKVLTNFFKAFWQKIFLVMVVLFVLDLIIGGLFFWRCFLNREQTTISASFPLAVNQGAVDDFSLTWEARKKAFEEVLTKNYSDPFNPYSF